MAFQEQKITDAISLTDFPGSPMQAYYLGSKEVNTKFGDQFLHNFQKEDGKKLSVWGFTSLNRLLEMTPKGTLTKITYLGKSETKNKYGNKSHLCTVFFDEEKKLNGFKEVEPEKDDEDENKDLPF